MNLVEAAMLDQERRILAASPKDLLVQRQHDECRLCGGKVTRWNRFGVCASTPQCRTLATKECKARRKARE